MAASSGAVSPKCSACAVGVMSQDGATVSRLVRSPLSLSSIIFLACVSAEPVYISLTFLRSKNHRNYSSAQVVSGYVVPAAPRDFGTAPPVAADLTSQLDWRAVRGIQKDGLLYRNISPKKEAEMAEENFTIKRLEDQISYYDGKSVSNQKRFKFLKILEIASAAIVPFAAGFSAPAYVTGAFGILIVITEGLQQLNQYQQNWIRFRSTCEALREEKYLYHGGAGPYANHANPIPLLAERIERLISQEHMRWVSVLEDAGEKAAKPA